MLTLSKFLTATALGASAIAPVGGTALAQTAKDLVGTWQVVSTTNTAADGTKTESFGPHVLGIAIFDGNGKIAVINVNPDTPKFAATSRLQGTPEENKAAVAGNMAYFGDYSIADKVITIHIEGSSYPNWTGSTQKRNIVSYTGDELKFSFVGSAAGQSEVVWKRLN